MSACECECECVYELVIALTQDKTMREMFELSEVCVCDIMKYFLMLWRTFRRHNVRLEVLFDITIYFLMS